MDATSPDVYQPSGDVVYRRDMALRKDPNPDREPFEAGNGAIIPPIGNRLQLLLDPLREPWERQERETEHNFGLFQMFMDMGPTRNIRSLSELSGRKVYHLRNLQWANRWRERCGAWDKYNQDIFLQRMADQRKRVAQEHIVAADALLKKARARLEQLDLSKISPQALVMMFSEAAKIHRLALGMEDSPVTTVSVQAAARSSDGGEEITTRLEVTTMHRSIMDEMVEVIGRMTPEQIEAGRREILALGTAEAPDVHDVVS